MCQQINITMKIIFITTGLKMGGAERQVVELAKIFSKSHSVSIISLTRGQYYDTNEVPVIHLNISKADFLSLIWGLIKYIRILKDNRPDVVHSHMVGANIFSRIARLFSNDHVHISTAHSIQEGGKVIEILYRITDFLTNLTTNVSPEAVEKYVRNGLAMKNKIKYVPNGIDIRMNEKYGGLDKKSILRAISSEIKPSDIIYLYAGRFNTVKDLPTMVQSFKRSLTASSNIRLIMCGDGPDKIAVEQFVNQNGLRKNIFLLGQQKDIGIYYSVADAFLLTSTYEGMPMCVLEAAVFSLPIISTDVGNIRDILYSGYPLGLCPPGNIACLSGNIEKLSKMSPEEVEKVGNNLRNIVVRQYSLEAVSYQWLAIYEEHLRAKQ